MTIDLLERGGTRAWPIEFVRETPGAVCFWVVEAPWAHPFWSQYFVTCCHLRHIEGGPAPVLFSPEATHETVVAALDPRVILTPEKDRRIAGYLSSLRPLNFVGQFAAEDDEEARRKIKNAVRLIVRGELSPDTDFRALWVDLFPIEPPRQNAPSSGARY